MNFNPHLNLRGKHAFFSPSQPFWINDSDEDIIRKYINSYASQVGTILHDVARMYIEHGVKMSKFDKKSTSLMLLEHGIPDSVVQRLPMDDVFANLMLYVNDAVAFRMYPEVVLYYSDNFFGTTDAIVFDEKQGFLRIHDLKNGLTPAKMEQLIIYNALFILEYGPVFGFKAGEINSELRIYQRGDNTEPTILVHHPQPIDIITYADRIVTMDRTIVSL